MANRTTLTPEKKRRFIEELSQDANVTRAALVVKVSRFTLYRARKDDEKFAEAWTVAVDMGTDGLEDEALRRAYIGTDKPVTYQGKITAVFKEYSDTLLMFMLKARRPEIYRDRQEIGAIGGGPVTLKVVYEQPNADSSSKDAPSETA